MTKYTHNLDSLFIIQNEHLKSADQFFLSHKPYKNKSICTEFWSNFMDYGIKSTGKTNESDFQFTCSKFSYGYNCLFMIASGKI